VKRAALGCAALWLALAGCRTAPESFSLPANPARAEQVLAEAQSRAGAVSALRGRARIGLSGERGESFFDLLVLVARPARLRVEAIGPLGGRALALATDGAHYDLYRAGRRGLARGEFHEDLLRDLGLPLAPEQAVGLLLAAPLLPGAERLRGARSGPRGALELRFADFAARFDRRGRLRLLCWAAPGEPGRCGGNAHLQVHYDDWRGTAGGAAFPHRLELRIPQSGARARLTLRQVELAPEFSPGVFRLSARRKGVSSGREAEK